MKIIPLKQRDSGCCAPTCIKMVADFFGLQVPLARIIRISGYDTKRKDGLRNAQIINSFQKLSLEAKEKKNVSWAELRRENRADTAIMVSWIFADGDEHVSVVEKVTKDHIWLADSIEGKIIKFAKNKFLALWIDFLGEYPEKRADIILRWMMVIKKKRSV